MVTGMDPEVAPFEEHPPTKAKTEKLLDASRLRRVLSSYAAKLRHELEVAKLKEEMESFD